MHQCLALILLRGADECTDSPHSEILGLPGLHISKCFCKSGCRVVQASGALAQQVLGRGIESITIKQTAHVHDLAALGGRAASEQLDQLLSVGLEDLGVDDPVTHEHWPDEMSGCGPEFAIGREDTVSQKFPPLAVKGLSLSEVAELARQQSLDVLGIGGEDDALDQGVDFRRGRRNGHLVGCLRLHQTLLPEIQILVLLSGLHRLIDEICRCNGRIFNACF